MSELSSIESATAAFFTKGDSQTVGLSISNIDIGKIIEIVSAIIQAAPAIEQGILSAAPFVEAISEMIANGGKPSDEQWATLKARLDVGSAALASAEAEAEGELLPIDDPAVDPAGVVVTSDGNVADLAGKVDVIAGKNSK